MTLLICCTEPTIGETVTLAWDRHNSHTNLASYSVKFGTTSGSYTGEVNVATNVTSTSLSNLIKGPTYFFVVTARNTTGVESDPSNEVELDLGNKSPTLDAIANVTTSEDGGQQTVNLANISSGATDEIQLLSVTATSSDPSLVPTPTVSYSSPASTGTLILTPVANANGTATVTVTVNDSQTKNNLVTRTFSVTVNAVNDSPTLNAPGNILINEDAGIQTVNLTGINSGAANEIQSLTVTATSSNPGLIATPAVSYTNPNANGTLTFVPAPNANGTATITVTVNDGQAPNNTVTRSFIVTVAPVNDPPSLAALSNLTMSEDAILQTVNLGGISAGPNESQTLTVSASSSNPGLIPNPTVNYTSPNSAGTLTFTPVANANGTATITVTINDGQSQNNVVIRTFTVTVNSMNDVPTLNPLNDLTISEDAGQQTINLANISSGAANENQLLSVTATSSNPGLIPNPMANYASPNVAGFLNFKSTTNAIGSTIIAVTVNDGQNQNNIVTRSFTITVNGVNDAPTISNIADQSINENTSTAALSFVVGDIETAAAGLTIAGTSSNPSLVPNGNITFSGSGANRAVAVTPIPTLFGSAIITVRVSDPDGGSASETFTLTVNGVNQPPTLDAVDDMTFAEDSGPRTVNLSGISTGATNELQNLTITATSSNPTLIPTPSISYSSPNDKGTLSFSPAANASGNASITITINDGSSQNNTLTRTFTVTVNAVNDPPFISDIAAQSISQNSATGVIPFTIRDVETPPNNLVLGISSSNPTLVPLANVVFGGSSSNRTIKVTPALNQFGSTTVTVTVSDGVGGIASDSFVVTVTPGNFPPTLDAFTDISIVEDAGPLIVTLSGISAGSTNESQLLTITTLSSNPALIPNPTVNYASPNAGGTLTFIPTTNAHGTATITVIVNDGQAQNNLVTQSFTVTVNAVNDAPTLNPIANLNLNENAQAQTVAFSGISSGAANENQTLTVTAISSNPGLVPNPTVNYFTPNTTGSLSFTPLTDTNGTATITVTVDDGQNEHNLVVRTFTITISGHRNSPIITDLSDQSISMSGPPLFIAFVVGDDETAATNLQVMASSSNPTLVWSNNIVLINNGSNRLASITSNPGKDGVAVITFTVIDGDGATASESFVLTVVAPNAKPTLDLPVNMDISEDSGARTVNLTGVSDGSTNEHQTLILTATSNNPGVIPHPMVHYTNPDTAGTLTFTPMTNKTGVATITITINDGQNLNNIVVRSFSVAVIPINDSPTIDPIPNQFVELNTATTTFPFTIGDPETLPGGLSVSAVSSDPVLVPSTNIVLGGTGVDRNIKVIPASFRSGTATITIFVTDGALTAASSFLLTVAATNTPPVILAPASLSTDSYTMLQNVAVIVTDQESRPQDLVLSATSYNQTVLPSTNIIFAGSGSNRTLTIKPVAGKSGPVSISLAVSDGRSITRTSCQLTVSTGTAPKAKLSVRKKGNGTVQPALDGQDLTIGQSYTLTAVPAAEEVFTGWSGAVTSGVPSITFVMASNLVLEASFTNNPYIAIKGAYNGLFHEAAEVRQASSGCFSINPNARGTFTGKIKIGSKTHPLGGRLNLELKVTNTIVRKDENKLIVELDFDTETTNQVVGRVTDGVWEAPLLGDRAVFSSKTNIAPYLGTYTLVIPGQDEPNSGPEGDGFGTVRVDANGLLSFVGTLADYTKVSQRVFISQGGQWPLYIPLYRGNGSILSWLMLTNRVTDDINGLLSWIKPSFPTSKQYAGGFTNEAFVEGSRYIWPMPSTTRLLDLADAQIVFTGGNLGITVTNNVLLSAQNKILNLSDNALSMTISEKNGLFSGSVANPSTGGALKFLGILLQKQNAGSGLVLGTDQNGRVTLGE